MNKSAWLIPFNNQYYLCWTDKSGQRRNRPLTNEEDKQYFTSPEPERVLNELLHSG